MMAPCEEAAILFAQVGSDITIAGLPTHGLFDTPHGIELSYGSGSQPSLLLPEDETFALDEGTAVQVFKADGVVRFSGVIDSVMPDGTGWVMLKLRADD